MHCKKHKRKTNHVVIVTSDAVDANVKQFRIKPWMSQVIVGVLCILIGVGMGYFFYEEQLWEKAMQRSNELQAVVKQLEDEKQQLMSQYETKEAEYQAEIDSLNEQIYILSETVNQKVQSESELSAILEAQSMPTEFPLTGSASMVENLEGDPICEFSASEGIMVVATASGTVTAVNEDSDYGYNVWIDHGNGYTTIYRNKGAVIVKQGDKVVQGTTLFIIDEENTKLGYQMLKDGSYISPMDMLAISG
uniref:murein hydrolase activator EnvC family protein n=1 Tax=Acetatifactor sp. TaxID=1872090 RepID=UPI0040573858